MYTSLLSHSSVYFCLRSFYLAASSAYLFLCAWHLTPVLTWPVLFVLCDLFIYLFLMLCVPRPQSATAVGGQKPASSIWSSTAALAVGGAV